MAAKTEHYYSPEKLAERLPSFNLPQIRRILSKRKQNGLDRYVHKIGRRLYLTERGWNQWLSEQVERKD